MPSGPFRRLDEAASKPTRLVVGLMSGTSADSIDVAVCRLGVPLGRVELLHYAEHAHDPDTRRRVLDVSAQGVRELAEVHVAIAEAFATACLETLAAAAIPIDEVDLIGSHGQTVYHHSGQPGAPRATLQLGDGDVIAERTGRPVVADFRARDIAAGGEGAPLSPLTDAVLFATPPGEPGPRRRAILNLGGIANLTVLDPDPARLLGFDTGPANALLDRLARRLTNGRQSCDLDGRIALAGQVNQALLRRLLADDPYLPRRPPKSTGFEMYGDAFVDRAVEAHGRADADLMATLTEFTALSVARALRDHVAVEPPVDEVVVAGGGVRNPALLKRLRDHLEPMAVRPSDEVGVPSDAREAMAFAILADMTLRGQPAWLPPVTGARGPRLLGKVCLP